MNKTTKNKWVAALRSGKYKQGRNHLCDLQDNTYCCLGVLCEISKLPSELTEIGECGYKSYYYTDKLRKSAYDLPPDFRSSLNISLSQQNQLIDMNDSSNADFHEIADWIEKNL